MRLRIIVPFFASLFALACDSDHSHGGLSTGSTCPTDNTLTYDTFGKTFFDGYCTRCHSADITGDLRLGAPSGMDFDTLAGIKQHLAHIDQVSAAGPNGTNTEMPDGNPSPTLAERTSLGQWLACGAP